MAVVNPYYQGYGKYKSPQLDFSAYKGFDSNFKFNPNFKIDSNLNLGGSPTIKTGYGNFTPPGLNLENPQGTANPSAPNYLGAAVGALGVGLNAYGMSQQGFQFSGLPNSQQDSNSAPAYTAGQLQNEAYSSRPKGAQTNEILGGAAQGAVAGSALGPVGAVAGGLIGGVASIFGGAARKGHEAQQKREALARVDTAQSNFNQSDLAYRNQQNQLYDYYNRNNTAGREYNVYKSRING